MAKSGNSSLVPQAREALDKFKMEAASEVGVNLKQGYNGDLTSRQAGSVGGQMVKKICPVQTIVVSRTNRCKISHCVEIVYNVQIGL